MESATIFLAARQATCNTCAAGTFHPVAVYPYRSRNFLPTRVRNSRPREGNQAHSCRHFSAEDRASRERTGYPGGWFSRNAKGARERRAGDATEDERCEVRQVRVPYFPEIRGLLECRVSLAEAPETASRGMCTQVGVGDGERWEGDEGRTDLVMRRHVSAGFVVVTS